MNEFVENGFSFFIAFKNLLIFYTKTLPPCKKV
jgi:hypothetical protein